MAGTAPAGDLLAARLVGREELQDRLDALLSGGPDSAMSPVLVSGRAGIGKSRLLHYFAETAEAHGAWILQGRAVDGGHDDPYRCLVEALSRFDATSGSRPGDQLWVAWEAVRRALRSSSATPVACAEELLRFLRTCRRRAPVALVLDDLHWADPDTLAALTYLCDNVTAHGTFLVMGARSEGLGAEMARLVDRRVVSLLEVPPLTDEAVHALALECLRADAVDPALTRFILERADGSPFAVEELLAGLARSGAIAPDGRGWRVEAVRLRTHAPPTVAASIARRASSLPPTTRRVLNAAALLGHRFDWQLLDAMVGVGEEQVSTALREAHDVGLVTEADGVMSFRHALTRDEIARTMLAPERRVLARRALEQMMAQAPDIDEERASLALELAEYAGQHDLRLQILLQSGRHAAEAGALGLARRRLGAIVEQPDLEGEPAWLDASVLLAEVLGTAGEHAGARAVGTRALALVAADDDVAHRLRVALVRAALSAGDTQVAQEDLRGLRGDSGNDDPLVDVLDAVLLLQQGDLDGAARIAERVAGDDTAAAGVRCEALEVLGRAARVRDVAEGEVWFERQLAEAERAEDRRWMARANHELGTIDLFDNLRVDRLHAARRLAVENGDPHTIAHADFHLAEAYVARGETLLGRLAAERAVDLSARIGSPVLPWAWLTTARSHAVDHDDPSLEAAVERARAVAGGEREAIEAGISGRVRALRAVFAADPDGAAAHLDDAVERLRRLPGHHFPHWGLWALLKAAAGNLDDDHVELVRSSPGAGTRFNAALLLAAVAVRDGSRTAPDQAAAGLKRCEEMLGGYEHAEWMVHVTRWMCLSRAQRDGWGDPVTWAQDGVRWFAAHHHEPLASSCRQFLRNAGATVPRRGRGHSQVPTPLLELGVTSREVDVLALIAIRLSNSEIGDRLVLSPRTVERHVSSLLAKTGASNRGELAQVAETLQIG